MRARVEKPEGAGAPELSVADTGFRSQNRKVGGAGEGSGTSDVVQAYARRQEAGLLGG